MSAMLRRVLPVLVACTLFALSGAARAAETIVRPGPSGGLGLWLVAGPLFGSEQALRFTTHRSDDQDARALVRIALDTPVLPGRTFELRSAIDGSYDLRKSLRAPQSNTYALFAGVLRATSDSKVVLQLGADDGVRVTVDGRVVLDRDLWRPALHDDDVVALDLPAGDHGLLIRLRQRSGEWAFRARLLDAADLDPARDVQFVLPDVAPDVAASHATRLVHVDVGLSAFADRYVPTVQVEAEGGLPVGTRLPLTVTATSRAGEGGEGTLFRVGLGDLPVGPRRVSSFHATLPAIEAARLEHGDAEAQMALRVSVGGHETAVMRQGHPAVRRALGSIDRALDKMQQGQNGLRDPAVVRATLALSRDRLETFLSRGDDDLAATVQEAAAAGAFAEQVIASHDPLSSIRGAMRLAYPSPLDAKDRPFGVYVPPSLGTERAKPSYPLVVVLHGLNGLPMQMIRIFFGNDHPWRRAPWEDRHVDALPDLDAFVVSPTGFGNMSYREFGEMDVMHVVEWMRKTYPIDADRVYVTGLSMGGTGAGTIGLRYADQFAAIEPLCGYHSYALRRDMANRKLRPWEKALASFWSNVSWAENGRNLPLYVVHGKQDKPVANSGVLIDRYTRLGYHVYDEHPDVGHNVWQQTYEHFKGYQWLAKHKRDPEPAQVVLKTASLRYADHAWVHVLQLEEHLSWGEVRARVRSRSSISIETSGVRALRLDRPASRVDVGSSLNVEADGDKLMFSQGDEVSLHREGGHWVAGAIPIDGLRKVKGLSGPIRDAFLEPLVFVVGTRDSSLTGANLQVARALAEPPYGVEARWPIVADVDVDETLASSHALFLIGSERSNAYVAKLGDRLPIRVGQGRVMAGDQSFEGAEVGTLFVYPNPLHPERYVVVLAAPDVAGTLRALSLPRMLPDFVIYDEKVAAARGQIVLGSASLVAGGMFDERWRLPASMEDPVAEERRKR